MPLLLEMLLALRMVLPSCRVAEKLAIPPLGPWKAELSLKVLWRISKGELPSTEELL